MLELAKSMAGEFESAFVSFSENGLCHAFLDEVHREGFEGMTLQYDTPRLIKALRELVRFLKLSEASAIVSHGYKSNAVGLLAANRLGIPIFSVSHGWTGESFRVRLYEALDKRILRWMDKVVCVSAGQAEKVCRSGVPADRCTVIRDAVRAERFGDRRRDRRDWLKRLFSERPRWLIGAAGRLSPEKGFKVLIDAAALVIEQEPDAGFLLFGEGVLRESIEKQIKNLGLEHRFLLMGFRPDIDQFFPNLDLFVQSSYTEGLPNVVLEAFAAGVPVVATDVGGTREIVQHAVNGYLVRAGDSFALSERILEIIADNPRRQIMSVNGRRTVVEHFSFSSQAKEYVRLLNGFAAV
jgi:glycosyltransferase involved in cell wall biosynthesis